MQLLFPFASRGYAFAPFFDGWDLDAPLARFGAVACGLENKAQLLLSLEFVG